jgi:hypothetical protein
MCFIGSECLLQFKVVGRIPLSDLMIHLSNFLPCWDFLGLMGPVGEAAV